MNFAATPIVAFIPTADFDSAKKFYVEKLGLPLTAEDGFALVLLVNGTMLRIAKVGAFKPAPFTVFGWEVEKIEEAVADLSARGITCQQFGLPGQDPQGIWTAPSGDKVAWFKDYEGNVLSISQHIR